MQYLVSEYQDKKNDDQFNSSGWDLINVPIVSFKFASYNLFVLFIDYMILECRL